MSKLYNLYNDLKRKDNKTVYLFKSGIFYIALADDAYSLSKILSLKITNLNATVAKCGFPCASIDKYSKILKQNNITFKIIEENYIIDGTKYDSNSKIKTIIDLLNNVSIDSLSVSESYTFIQNLKDLAKDL